MHNLSLMSLVEGLRKLASFAVLSFVLPFGVGCAATGDPAQPEAGSETQVTEGAAAARPGATAATGSTGTSGAMGTPATSGTSNGSGAKIPAPTTFAEQVRAGSQLFAQRCAGCHGASGEGSFAPRLIGLEKGALASFADAGDLADYVIRFMPPGRAGTLPREEYFSIVAFTVDANGIAAGDALLTDERASNVALH